MTLGFVTLFVTLLCVTRGSCVPWGLLQVSGDWGSVLLGIFILEPGFLVCLCLSLGLHQRVSSSPEPLKCKASSEAVQQDGDPAGVGNLELSPWNLVPLSLEAQVTLFCILCS